MGENNGKIKVLSKFSVTLRVFGCFSAKSANGKFKLMYSLFIPPTYTYIVRARGVGGGREQSVH